MRKPVVRTVSTLGSVLIAWCIVGCSDAPGPTYELPPSLRTAYAELRDAAHASGGSVEQLAALDDAIDTGTPISFEVYKQAKEREMDCIRDLGFSVDEVRESTVGGVRAIQYVFGGFSDEAHGDALLDDAEACVDHHARFVGLAYETPPSTEERDAMREERRPALVECLEDDGVTVRDDDDWSDLLKADGDLARVQDALTCYERLGLIEID